MNFGPRPETSSVTTDNYQRGFTDRWYDNELRITRGAATGVDILDRHDDQFDAVDASCVRTQDTFRQGEGAFIVNKDGPVRAIRDFVGANSGPHVQRQHIFYDDARGHQHATCASTRSPASSTSSTTAQAGLGLTYENGVQTPGGVVSGTPPGGVTIDGQPDAVTGAGTSRLPGFESVDGPQGSLTMTQRLLTNNPDPGYHLVYRDGNLLGRTRAPATTTSSTGPADRSSTRRSTTPTRPAGSCGAAASSPTSSTSATSTTGRPARPNGPQRLAEVQAPLELSVQGVDLSESTGTIVVKKDAVPDDAAGLLLHGGRRPLAGELLARRRLRPDALEHPDVRERRPPARATRSPRRSPSGWEQHSATCDDGSPPSAINVSAGETVTCTFTNARFRTAMPARRAPPRSTSGSCPPTRSARRQATTPPTAPRSRCPPATRRCSRPTT